MKNVKKFITVSLVLGMICMFTACGNDKKNDANDMAGNTNTTTDNGAAGTNNTTGGTTGNGTGNNPAATGSPMAEDEEIGRAHV